jgi:flagellar biosynthesis protein FlhB
MSEERTEEATPKKRAEARKKGQVARSPEVTTTVGLLAGLAILQASGGAFLQGVQGAMRSIFGHLPTTEPTVASLGAAGLAWAIKAFLLAAPLLVGMMIIGVLVNMAQIGFLFAPKLAAPDPKRINPAEGFKRVFGRRGAVELLKGLVKLAIVGGVAYGVFTQRYAELVMLTGSDLLSVAGHIAAAVFELAYRAGFWLLALALLDYGYQRWEYNKSLKMSTQEVREEMKQAEGDPHIKARIRRTQRQMAMRRMMQAVPTSDVVLTNPTHLAVALHYDAGRMAAPVVVAKGADLVAERIKTLAREHGVPVVENKPLARALFAACEIEAPVPADLYQAVAEVLAFIYRLRRPARASAPRPPLLARPALDAAE